ncbi:MAG: hypothetical protein ATN36_02785 [Epulopiscium sp. Nele67-Bin005]|nr:MAG: hypothetical protein ATN36_02785 [Epulopiscium sp. Nele67-Bin005]
MIVYDGEFIIGEDSFDEMSLNKTESIMCQGNGYICVRAYAEEKYPLRVVNTFIAGTFNKYFDEVTELPNVADAFSLDIFIEGVRFFLTRENVSDYNKSLNLKTGELVRSFKFRSCDNEFEFEMRRFISADNIHLGASKIKVIPLIKSANIVVVSGIDGKVTNSGDAHFIDVMRRFYEREFIVSHTKTSQSNIDVFVNVGHRTFVDGEEIFDLPKPKMGRKSVFGEFNFEVGSELIFEKYVSYYTSIDKDVVDGQYYEILRENMKLGYEGLFLRSAEALFLKLWKNDYIEIKSKNYIDQLSLNYALYHMFVMTPAHDNRMNIGAKGLSGEGYKGHTFWDTEVFLLPRFIVQNPLAARSLLEYRYLGLDGAREKAKLNGYCGAMFPWESANPDDGEVTPKFSGVDVFSGEPAKVITGDIEIHIVADVAFGVYLYRNFTGDDDFMCRFGYEIIFETAKFWNSRLEDGDDGLLHICDVIGPDEYCEHVDDNMYTNYLAKWNMEYAIDCYNEILHKNPNLLIEIDLKTGICDVINDIKLRYEKVYISTPDEDLIINQDSSYRNLPEIDLTKYKEASLVATISQDYNMEQISKLKVSKQADVMVLFLLFGEKFSDDIKKANFDYYEPFCLHDSSLSLSSYAILANDIGYFDYGYELFSRATMIDISQEMHSCDDGVHAASYGGVWQCVVYGFAGFRMIGGVLHINPKLPEEITKLKFGFYYLGRRLEIKIENGKVDLKNISGEAVSIIVGGKLLEV